MVSESTSLPLVSIITPAYNAAKYLTKTILSVQHQDYQNIEHVIIDDGSTDNTPSLLANHEKEYNLKWMSQSNEGQAVTVNRGFEMAKGDILIWLNADDVLFEKNVVSDVVKVFKEKSADVVFGHMAIIDSCNRLSKILFAPPKLDKNILALGHFAACIFYRRDIATRYLLNADLDYALDYDQCLRMALDECRFVFLGKTLLGWRKHEDAKSLKNKFALLSETNQILKKYHMNKENSHWPLRIILFSYIGIRKFLGIFDITKFYSLSRKKQLPFTSPKQSLLHLLIRQIIPYV